MMQSHSRQTFKPICSRCGSDNVTSDAIARWNVERQAWEIAALLDNSDCEVCGDETSLVDIKTEEMIGPEALG
jgi:hypothetical protein